MGGRVSRTQPRPDRLAGVVDRWSGLRVVVVGDVMLDEWRFTDPQRLAREAPAPVVTLRREEDAAGGAGNTAVNLAALGARPVLIAPLGSDAAGGRVRACLARAGVEDRTVAVAGYRTRMKRRVVAADQILFCEEDARSAAPPPPPGVDGMLRVLRSVLPTGPGPGPVLVVCDYGLGALGEPVREWLVSHRDAFAMVALDAHDLGRWTRLAPTVVTPSYVEAVPLLGPSAAPDDDREVVVLTHGARLLRAMAARIVAVTLDVAGAVVLSAEGS